MSMIRIPPLLPFRVSSCPACHNPAQNLKEDTREHLVRCIQCKSAFLYDSEQGLLAYTGPAVTRRWKRFFKYSLWAFVIGWLFDFTRLSEVMDFWAKIGLYVMLGLFWHLIWLGSMRSTYVDFVPTHIREDRPSLNMQHMMIYLAGVLFWAYTATSLFFGVDSLI